MDADIRKITSCYHKAENYAVAGDDGMKMAGELLDSASVASAAPSLFLTRPRLIGYTARRSAQDTSLAHAAGKTANDHWRAPRNASVRWPIAVSDDDALQTPYTVTRA
jgi:hypothetical protein